MSDRGEWKSSWRQPIAWLAVLMGVASGCTTLNSQSVGSNDILSPEALSSTGMPGEGPYAGDPLPPSELSMVSQPEYRLEPPDVLLITVPRLMPKPPYFIHAGDVLRIIAANTPPEEPIIANDYVVSFEGTVSVGPNYQAVRVAGLTQQEAQEAVIRELQRRIPDASASVSVIQVSGLQPIDGVHLIYPDGKITLGMYGRVYVAGMTMGEAKAAIEEHLSQFLLDPVASVSLYALNSQAFYIIQENPLLGNGIIRVPITGNDTVLDALALVGGPGQVASQRVWIARPSPSGQGCDQVIPVDLAGITKGARTATNYELFPGDRLYIAQNRLVALDAMVQKVLNPFERIFGFSFLGAQTLQIFQRFPEGRVGF